MRNKILTICFFIFIACSAIAAKTYRWYPDFLSLMKSQVMHMVSSETLPTKNMQDDSETTGAGTLPDGTQSNNDATSSDSTSSPSSSLLSEQPSSFLEKFSSFVSGSSAVVAPMLPYQKDLIRLNGGTLKALGVRSYYNMQYGMNISTRGYNVGRYNETSTDYEVAQMIAFKEYLDDKGIGLLYVSEPAKYIDDDFYTREFGGESYLNRNTDKFLERIGEAGIPYLDLRDEIRAEDINPLSLFYKTDHHWTVPTSKWTAEKIVTVLNRDFDYDIDLSLYDESRFVREDYQNAWLGEQGHLVSDVYIGLDDFTMLKPAYDTSFDVRAINGGLLLSGPFDDVFILDYIYDMTDDVYESPSWHYSYNAFHEQTIHNNKVKGGNILVLGDSYESTLIPFLALGVEDVKLTVRRDSPYEVRDLIEYGNFDTVIIAYAQFMIGSHDSETNANYKMFELE